MVCSRFCLYNVIDLFSVIPWVIIDVILDLFHEDNI